MPQILGAVARASHAPVDFATLLLDDPRPDEVLVELRASGICHSDLHARDQTYPFPLPGVLGHEGVGVVAAIGSAVTTVGIGERVVMSQSFCGACPACLRGRVSACPNRTGFRGSRADLTATTTDEAGNPVSGMFMGQSSWATHALVREPNVVRLPDDLPWEVAAPMACGVQTGAGAVLNALQPEPGESIVVFGAGAVGLSAVMAAKHIGCGPIIVVDLLPARLETARELGATHTVDPTSGDPVAFVHDVTGAGADFSIEASGARTTGPMAVECLSHSGRCVLLGGPAIGARIDLDWNGLVGGRGVSGAPFGTGTPTSTIGKLLQLRAEGGLPIEKIVRTYPFRDIQQAIADTESGVTIKPVLLFD